jgi:hypothetical protein
MNCLTFSTFLLLICSFANAQSRSVKVIEHNIVVPHGYKRLGGAKGDLDKDGIPELVVVLNTPKKIELARKGSCVYINKTALLGSFGIKALARYYPASTEA